MCPPRYGAQRAAEGKSAETRPTGRNRCVVHRFRKELSPDYHQRVDGQVERTEGGPGAQRRSRGSPGPARTQKAPGGTRHARLPPGHAQETMRPQAKCVARVGGEREAPRPGIGRTQNAGVGRVQRAERGPPHWHRCGSGAVAA